MSSDQYDILLVTQTFPFGEGEQFLETEIEYLAQRFRRVLLVPTHMDGHERNVPENVFIEKSFALSGPHATLDSVIDALSHHLPIFARELVERILPIASPRAIVRAGRYLTVAHQFSVWLRQYITTTNLDTQRTVFYTYWFGATTLGIGLLRKQFPSIHLISHGHGGDLYEERSPLAYLPFRYATFASVDLFAAISAHGCSYIEERYPNACRQLEVHRLGVRDSGIISPSSDDNCIRLLSCSFLVPVKRLPLLIEALHYLANQHPQLVIEWTHLGDGIQRAQLEHCAREQLSSNVSWRFQGQMTNQEVIAYYGSHPVDLFINVSESEGIPVSIMEAQSCGIPVLATAVGGVPEIVKQENGYLLDSNPSARQVADAIYSAIVNRDEWSHKRQCARETWHTLYNADINYPRFTDRLMQLLIQGI